MGANHDALRGIVQDLLQEMLEGEMTEALGAGKSERSDGRIGYRSGHYNRTLITRVGKLELRVPQDRDGRFSTELFERYQRSEQALIAALAEMYFQGVSTRKVKAITEELCGHRFSASTISAINQRLDESLTAFARRRLEEPFAYLIIDAKYEKVRQAGVVQSCAVLVALGVDWEGQPGPVELRYKPYCSGTPRLVKDTQAVLHPLWRRRIALARSKFVVRHLMFLRQLAMLNGSIRTTVRRDRGTLLPRLVFGSSRLCDCAAARLVRRPLLALYPRCFFKTGSGAG